MDFIEWARIEIENLKIKTEAQQTMIERLVKVNEDLVAQMNKTRPGVVYPDIPRYRDRMGEEFDDKHGTIK